MLRADLLRPNLVPLPVDGILPELVAELERSRAVVLEATPGAGKTTRVPQALLKAAFRGDREILVLEPRRLAAKMAAHRVADELGAKIGGLVGYQFRFENVGSVETRVKFLTEGMFVRRLLSDPKLSNVAVVVIDEFHERHLQGDVALAMLKHLQNTARPDLRVVVMSATLDASGIAAYLGDAKVLKIETRRFEVTIDYMPLADQYLDRQVATAVKRIAPESEGDLLVFLPGVSEIRRAESAIKEWSGSSNFLVFPLYGDLSREEQDRAVKPAQKRKIILSTNVAETSLTIEGVKVVIDSGLARIASHSWWSGLPALRTRPISRASCIQRTGRAGRLGPGRCVRLFNKESFDTRPPFEIPEIQRADLSQTVLELARLGVNDPAAFPWFEPPQAAALEAARKLLFRLGATDQNGKLTTLGSRMAEMPAHPRLARLVLAAEAMGLAREGATCAAMLSEGHNEALDLMTDLERYRPFGPAERAREQLLRNTKKTEVSSKADLRKALLAAFPDRVAKKRELASNVARNTSGNKVELVFGTGGSAMVESGGRLDAEYFVAIDIEERAKNTRICRSICAIEPDWLFDIEPEGVSEASDLRWDENRQRVIAGTRMVYDGLTLMESKGEADPGAVAELLAKQAVSAGIGKFCDEEALKFLLERIRFLRTELPDPSFPEISNENLADLLKKACEGRASFSELKEADLLSEIKYGLTPEQQQKLEKFAPESVQLPGGRRVRINYEQGKPPWIESRLQDFFGMKAGPSVLGGRVPLTLHLLAPNMRAVQVTSDLVGFWARVYPDLRRELGRRYPRHSWPEDPLTAEPPAPRGRR